MSSILLPTSGRPAVAPDGGRIVFTADVSGQPQLFLVSRRGDSSWSTARQLTSEGGWAGRWSPDGHTIVYCQLRRAVAHRTARGQSSATAQGRSHRGAGAGACPVEPRRQDHLLQGVRSRRALQHLVGPSDWWHPRGSSCASMIPARPSTRPEFATDGKRFFFTVGTRQSDIWAMELKTRH